MFRVPPLLVFLLFVAAAGAGFADDAISEAATQSFAKSTPQLDFAYERGVRVMKGQPPVDLLIFFLGGDYKGFWTVPRQNA